MLAGQGISAVAAYSGNSVNVWTAEPTGTGSATLDGYLRSATTTYFYCWDTTAKITRQDEVTTAC